MRIRGAILLVLVACGARSSAPPRPALRPIEATERNGDRFVRRGARVFDKEWGTGCTLQSTSTSTWGCVPSGDGVIETEYPEPVFADAECSQFAVLVSWFQYASWSSEPRVLTSKYPGDCAPHAHRVLERSITPSYSLRDGRCVTNGPLDRNALLVSIAEVPAPSFTMAIEPIDDELAARWFSGPDGSRFFEAFTLRRHDDQRCEPTATFSGIRCVPPSAVLQDYPWTATYWNTFADAGCRTAPLIDTRLSCEPAGFLHHHRGCADDEVYETYVPKLVFEMPLGVSECRPTGKPAWNVQLRGFGRRIPIEAFPRMALTEVGHSRIVERRVVRSSLSAHFDFFDRKLGMACVPGRAEDGRTRCLPTQDAAVLDARCPRKAATVACNTPERSTFVRVRSRITRSTCHPDCGSEVWRRAPANRAELESSGCKLDKEHMGSTQELIELTQKLDAAVFAEIE